MADDQQQNDAVPSAGGTVARDTDGRGSENQDPSRPTDPNTEAVTQAFEGAGHGLHGGDGRDDAPPSGISRDGPDAIDLEDMSGATRREPGR